MMEIETIELLSAKKMCFSASASFTASGLLIPTGVYCVTEAMASNQKYLPIALWPLFFGIQQVFEGFLWLAMGERELPLTYTAALGFLFFSHFFWLFWVPFSAYCVETHKGLRVSLMGFTVLGSIYGALLYLPLFSDRSLWNVEIVSGSIHYATQFIYQDSVPKNFTVFLYGAIILAPLLISSKREVNFLGASTFLAAIATYLFFSYAFTSVWCFFAALLSTYIVYLLNQVARFSRLI